MRPRHYTADHPTIAKAFLRDSKLQCQKPHLTSAGTHSTTSSASRNSTEDLTVAEFKNREGRVLRHVICNGSQMINLDTPDRDAPPWPAPALKPTCSRSMWS